MMAVSAWMAAWHAGMDSANHGGMTEEGNRKRRHAHGRNSKTASDARAASASASVMLVGEVRAFEVEHSGCAAVPHAFIQRSGQAAQPMLEFLADLGRASIQKKLHRRLRQIVGGHQQLVSHSPLVTIGLPYRSS